MRLKEKVAVITGGGRGLGRAAAIAFAKEGAKVVLAARSKEAIDHVAEELRSLKKTCLAVPTDVSDEKQVDNLVQQTLEAFGTIDILVNNAGTTGPVGPFHEVSLAEWDRTIRVNLTATFLCSKAVLPVMIERKHGKIINVGTTLTPRPNLTPYCVAKAGVIHFSRQIAREVKNHNIQINVIHPGVMDTRMQAEIREAGVEAIGTDLFERIKEEGILSSPDEPARLILYLASEESGTITGEYLSFDDREVKFLISRF